MRQALRARKYRLSVCYADALCAQQGEKMSIVNFRVDTNSLKEVVKRLEDNKISMGWGGGNINLDLRNNVDFRKAYKNITNRRINSIMKIKNFKDGDIIVVPKIPKNGKFIIGFVDGDFPNCYEYIENDQTHLNHCIKLKKVYGLKSELDIHNVKVHEWYAKLGYMRLPIYPLYKYNKMFNELINEIENDKVSLLSSSNLGDFVEKIRTEIHDKIRAELEKMSPNNSDISFENVCRKIIESFGYRCIGNNHHANGGDADLIFTIEDVESDSLNNPFIMKEKKLYVQVKRHHGNSGKKAVEQIVKIIKEDKVESVQGCAITLGVFNEDAEIFAEENEIILINGNELIDLFIERLL
jgi:hypothetical protein